MKCMNHMSGKYERDECPICMMTVEVNRALARVMPESPRYRYYEIKRQPRQSRRTFEWTTQTADNDKYWAIERRWVRVKNGERGKIVRKVGFAQRNKAKARAYAWYLKAKGE